MRTPIYIRDVAKAGGVTPEAVRYYERRGLIDAPERTGSRYRVYGPDTLDRMRFIKRAQRLGLNLDEIRCIVEMKCSMRPPCDCVLGMLKRKVAGIEEQIAEMKAMRREVLKVMRKANHSRPLSHAESVICPLIEDAGDEHPPSRRRRARRLRN